MYSLVVVGNREDLGKYGELNDDGAPVTWP
jgi:hypothetical protein